MMPACQPATDMLISYAQFSVLSSPSWLQIEIFSLAIFMLISLIELLLRPFDVSCFFFNFCPALCKIPLTMSRKFFVLFYASLSFYHICLSEFFHKCLRYKACSLGLQRLTENLIQVISSGFFFAKDQVNLHGH